MKNFMYATVAIFFLTATSFIGIMFYTHFTKVKVTCSMTDKVSVSAYVGKDDVNKIADMCALSTEGVKAGAKKSRYY